MVSPAIKYVPVEFIDNLADLPLWSKIAIQGLDRLFGVSQGGSSQIDWLKSCRLGCSRADDSSDKENNQNGGNCTFWLDWLQLTRNTVPTYWYGHYVYFNMLELFISFIFIIVMFEKEARNEWVSVSKPWRTCDFTWKKSRCGAYGSFCRLHYCWGWREDPLWMWHS
jgi:hypothetical protein